MCLNGHEKLDKAYFLKAIIKEVLTHEK